MNEKERTADVTSEEIQRKTSAPPTSLLNWLVRVLQGAIIGTGAILPGISGGVLCVVFGIYQPMMALLAHPFKTFRTHAKLLLPVLIGFVLGFFGLAKLVDWMFKTYYNIATWLFVGLIAGMVPSLFKEAGKEGRSKSSWITLGVSLVLILAVLLIIKNGTPISITPNIWWFFVCGVLWGVSLVVPGLSSSSILIYLGLYQPMAEGIADVSPQVVIPLFIGVFLTILLLARVVDYLFKKHYAIAFHMILGFVIASTIAIIPIAFSGTMEAVFCLVFFVVGFIIAWLMDKLSMRFKKPEL